MPNFSSRPIKVLYIHHVSPAGGSATSLRYLIESFPPGTVTPLVLGPPGPALEAFKQSGIQATAIPSVSAFSSMAGAPLRGIELLKLLRTVWRFRSASPIKKAIAEFQPDVVHLNERALFHPAIIAKSAGVPVVMHARNVADREVKWAHQVSVYLLNKYADVVIAIDESVRNAIREVKKCQVVYNPLPLTTESLNTLPQTDIQLPKSNLNLTRVTFLAMLHPIKGIWDLLEAAKLLKHQTDINFQIAGSNARPPEFYRSIPGKLSNLLGLTHDVETEMKEFITRESLQDTVIQLGYVDAPWQLFCRTDLLVFPSHLNGPSRSVFEAGIYGIPSIVSMRDKVEDIVTHHVTGLIVPEKNPLALAQAISRLAIDNDLRTQLGQNAKKKYKSQFDPDINARKVLEIYKDIASKR